MTEYIDIFDGNHQLIGNFERVQAHMQGLWHQTFHCWIVSANREGSSTGGGSVILQLRSREKKNYPDMLDITAAGHLEAGETPADGIREIEEELGITVDAADLVSLGIKHDVMDEPNGIRNREFSHVYLYRDDRELDQYRISEDEVSGLVRLDIAAGLELFSGNRETVACNAIRAESGELRTFTRDVSTADLIPRVDQYYLKVLIMADLMLKGHPYLSI